MRLAGPEGRLTHAYIQIDDSPVMLVDEDPPWGCLGPIALKGSPVTIHLQVEDVDAVLIKLSKPEQKLPCYSRIFFGGIGMEGWKIHSGISGL